MQNRSLDFPPGGDGSQEHRKKDRKSPDRGASKDDRP
jgi:hypothetical protein